MKAPNVYIGSSKNVQWKTDPTPDDDQDRGVPREVVQILGFDPIDEKHDAVLKKVWKKNIRKSHGGYGMSDIALEKAKYTRRYRGPDGKWQYEYGQKKGRSKGPTGHDSESPAYSRVPGRLPTGDELRGFTDALKRGGGKVTVGDTAFQSLPHDDVRVYSAGDPDEEYTEGRTMDRVGAWRLYERMKKEGGMRKGMRDIALVVMLEGQGTLEKSSHGHPAKLSKVGAKAETNNPSNHKERMKFARMFAEMCGASKPEDEGAHQPSTVDHKGRVAGQKSPYDKGSTKVSGMGSQAHNNFGTRIVKPSGTGASAYRDPSMGGTISSKK